MTAHKRRTHTHIGADIQNLATLCCYTGLEGQVTGGSEAWHTGVDLKSCIAAMATVTTEARNAT